MITEIIHLIFWLSVAIFETVNWIYLWQAKEYRLDRFRAHWHTPEGKRDLFPNYFLAQLLVGFSLVWWLPARIGFWLVLVFLSNRLFSFFTRWRRKRLWLPLWTTKTRLIGLLAFSIQALGMVVLIRFLPVWQAVFWAQLLIPMIVLLAVLGLVFPARMVKKRIIDQARTRIEKHPNLKIIGITGSFGKTSTKEFLTAFLKTKYLVLATEERENTLIGIAQRINKGLKDDHRYFVVEMGAYQPGEIEQMCRLAPPRVAVVTALAPQHLGLFGTFDRLVKTKMELVENITKSGYVVANGDDRRLVKEVRARKKKTTLYSLVKDSELTAGKIRVGLTEVSFEYSWMGKKYLLTAPLLGRQNVPNLMAAIGVALREGIDSVQISTAAKKLTPLSGTMKVVSVDNGPMVVDDSYNANPEAVLAAVDYLSVYKGQKWLVLQPMIEMGKVSVDEHKRVLQTVFRVCDRIIMTNTNYWFGLKNDFPSRDWAKISLVRTPAEFESLGAKRLKEGDVILFEGKESHKYLEQFIGHAV